VLPAVLRWMSAPCEIIALIKPQFEAQRDEIGEGGIVTDDAVHQRVVNEVSSLIVEMGGMVGGVTASPILGGDRNREFLIWGRFDGG